MWDFQYLQGKLIALLVFSKVINSLRVQLVSLPYGQPVGQDTWIKRDLVFQKDKES